MGIPENTLRSRIAAGEDVSTAFTRPPDKRFHPAAKPDPKPVPPPPKLESAGDGRACCRWTEHGTRRVAYFGDHADPASAAAYARWCAEWYAHQGRPAAGEATSVAGLIVRFLDWAKRYYVKRGRPTSEVHGFRTALAAVNALYGDTDAAAFGPRELKAVRAGWVKRELSLNTVNTYANKVARAFSWGVGEGLIPAATADALRHVKPLVPGRSEARVPAKVQATPEPDFLAALPHLHKDPARRAVLAAVLRVQRHTGLRPGELCRLVPEQVDRSRTPWLFTPPDGKTQHLDKDRRVFVGPQARAVLGPLLAATLPGSRVFRMVGRNGTGEVGVSVAYLRERIAAACALAGVPAWRPNQVRHLRANDVHERYEDDAAVAAALGNTPEVARQVYVDHPGDRVARRIAEELG